VGLKHRGKIMINIGKIKLKLISDLEELIKEGVLTFDDLQTLSGQAYAKEAAQDEQE
jgi:hypothetical protein